MRSSTKARIGVVGEISGFVIAEDHSFQARLDRSLAIARARIRTEATHLRHMLREKAEIFRHACAQLRLAKPGLAKPEIDGVGASASFDTASDFADLPAAKRIAEAAEVQPQPAQRRSKRLAGVLAVHWLVRVTQMRLAARFARIDRYRFGVATLALTGGLAMGAALLLPDAEPPSAAVVAVASPPQPVAPVQLPARSGATGSAMLPGTAKVDETWVSVKRPVLLYNLEAPDVEAASLVYRVAMRGKAARQDSLTWSARSQPAGGKSRPAVHLVVERFEKEAPTFRPLYPDIASRAAEQGISIDRMTTPGDIRTKFGTVQVAEAVLATEQGQLGCLVFRQIDTIGLVVSGWYCGSAQRPADRVSLSCFIDRLDLIGAGQDSTLKKHFAGAERNRKSCAGARQSGRKLTWLDHEAPMPALKLSANTR